MSDETIAVVAIVAAFVIGMIIGGLAVYWAWVTELKKHITGMKKLIKESNAKYISDMF